MPYLTMAEPMACRKMIHPTYLVGLVKPLVGWNMMRIVAMTSNTVTIQIKDYLLQRYREGQELFFTQLVITLRLNAVHFLVIFCCPLNTNALSQLLVSVNFKLLEWLSVHLYALSKYSLLNAKELFTFYSFVGWVETWLLSLKLSLEIYPFCNLHHILIGEWASWVKIMAALSLHAPYQLAHVSCKTVF